MSVGRQKAQGVCYCFEVFHGDMVHARMGSPQKAIPDYHVLLQDIDLPRWQSRSCLITLIEQAIRLGCRFFCESEVSLYHNLATKLESNQRNLSHAYPSLKQSNYNPKREVEALRKGDATAAAAIVIEAGQGAGPGESAEGEQGGAGQTAHVAWT